MMQNLTSCPKGQYITPKKLFNFLIKCSQGKKPTYNLKHTNVHFQKKMQKAFMPLSYHTLKQMNVDLTRVQFVVRQNLLDRGCCRLFAQSKRYLSTTPVQNADKQNEQPPKESSNDSDKDPNEKDASMTKLLQIIFVMYLLYTIYNLQDQNQQQDMPVAVSWNEFVYQMLAKGEVQKITVSLPTNMVLIELHSGAVINGKVKGHKKYYMHMPNSDDFEEKLRKVEQDLGIKYDEVVPVEYERSMETVAAVARVVTLLAILLGIAILRRKMPSINPMNMFSNMKRAKFTLVEPQASSREGVRFSDVAGLKEAKTEVMEFVDYLKNPTRYKSLGAKIPKGALLLGPPGCGKTLLAKAIATEASVPFLSMNGSEFIELLGGLGAARVRDLFEEGKKRAPSIIYIDEIDTIGKKRSEVAELSLDSEADRTLNQLLVEMDGMASKDDVIILASTNRPEVLDKALLRPGRFDRHILIDLPTLEERKQIFETHMKRLVLESLPSKYSGYLAYLTPNFSGADIANVCNEAALHAARLCKKAVDGADLMYAIDRTIGGTEKKSHAMLPAEKRVVAYRQAGHAVVGWLLEHTEGLLKITIVPRTNQRIGFSQSFVNDRKLHTQEELIEKICELLGGRAAEQLIFNRVSTSEKQDELQKVTKIAYHQVQQWGMSPKVGLVSFPPHKETDSKKPYSKKLAGLMDIEARRIIAEAYERTEKLLAENKDKLVAVAEELLKKETLNYEDVEKLIGPPPFPKKQVDESAYFKTPYVTPEQKPIDETIPADKKSAESNGAVPGQTST